MASFGGGTTSGNVAFSSGGPGDHAACDAAVARLRERAMRAEAKLAAIAARCRERIDGPGRHGLTMAAAQFILGIAEGGSEEKADDA